MTRPTSPTSAWAIHCGEQSAAIWCNIRTMTVRLCTMAAALAAFYALMLAAPLALAQESGDNAQAQEAEDTAPAEQAATPAETGETPAKETGSQTRSPFDYRATEQISEDLSVSFPVDI